MEQTWFFQQHLNRVSRSFAFCIERLPSPLREEVGLAYLLCRILDTIEDALWTDLSVQLRQFECFDRYLEVLPVKSDVSQWAEAFSTGISDGEKLLLNDAWQIFSEFHALALPIRQILKEPIQSMSRGMVYFSRRKSSGVMRLMSLADVNQYCFFVAGVVGEILTRLVLSPIPQPALSPDLLVDAFHFGLFLQKVNLLKDQLSDEMAGRLLIPQRSEVMQSLKAHAEHAMAYIMALPETLKGYRLFCSWSLFLGLASLPFIERSWIEKQLVKIPREQTQLLLLEIEKLIDDNSALQEFFQTLLFMGTPEDQAEDQAEDQMSPTRAALIPEFSQLYRGQLTQSDLVQILL